MRSYEPLRRIPDTVTDIFHPFHMHHYRGRTDMEILTTSFLYPSVSTVFTKTHTVYVEMKQFSIQDDGFFFRFPNLKKLVIRGKFVPQLITYLVHSFFCEHRHTPKRVDVRLPRMDLVRHPDVRHHKFIQLMGDNFKVLNELAGNSDLHFSIEISHRSLPEIASLVKLLSNLTVSCTVV